VPPIKLADLQLGLRDLIKQRRSLTCYDHSYLHQVAASPQLALLREIAEWWRKTTLDATVPLTMALLNSRGISDAEVSQFTAAPGLDPNPRNAARAFLARQTQQKDSLVAAVAQFEAALHAVRIDGSQDRFRIEWPCDPLPVLNALLYNREIVSQPPECVMEVSADIPGTWQVVINNENIQLARCQPDRAARHQSRPLAADN
jgi:hypothetical protein